MKLDLAVAQIKKVTSGDTAALSTLQAPGDNRGPRPGGGNRPPAPTGPFRPTFETAPASKTPTRAPDTVHIDELTWEETRDAIKGGKRVVIVPTGGTEKNGYHMVLGKHNFVVRKGAEDMARRLNGLVAPVLQYVPEGDPDRQNVGAISVPSPAYDGILDAAARSLRIHGFTDILFIGDSGPNQAGMQKVADALNAEWKDAGVKVYALTDYYNMGRDNYRAYMEAAFGYDDETVGAHAGISDTSQMLFIHPTGVRKDRILPWGGPKDSGVSGDPTKATAEIGKMGIAFKVNAGINQYKKLKNPTPQRTAPGGQ